MHHPMDVPSVKTGADLMNFFYKVRDILHSSEQSDIKMTTKLDGNNCSFRLNEVGEFVADRGTKGTLQDSKYDVLGATRADLHKRFPNNPGLAATYDKLLYIFAQALEHGNISEELIGLGLMNKKGENPADAHGRVIDAEWLERPEGEAAQNAIAYDFDFIALHKINEFDKNRNESAIPLTDAQSNLLKSLAAKVEPFADEFKMKVRHSFEDISPIVDEHGQFAPMDLDGVLAQRFSAYVSEGQESPPATIKEILNGIKDIKQLQLYMIKPTVDLEVQNSDKTIDKFVKGRPIGAVSKKNYNLVLNKQVPLDSVYSQENPKDTQEIIEKSIQGAMIWHALRELGHEILKGMQEGELGSFVVLHHDPADPSKEIRIAKHEGLTIYDSNLTGDNEPVKITGEFIVQGVGGRYAKLAQLG